MDLDDIDLLADSILSGVEGWVEKNWELSAGPRHFRGWLSYSEGKYLFLLVIQLGDDDIAVPFPYLLVVLPKRTGNCLIFTKMMDWAPSASAQGQSFLKMTICTKCPRRGRSVIFPGERKLRNKGRRSWSANSTVNLRKNTPTRMETTGTRNPSFARCQPTLVDIALKPKAREIKRSFVGKLEGSQHITKVGDPRDSDCEYN